MVCPGDGARGCRQSRGRGRFRLCHRDQKANLNAGSSTNSPWAVTGLSLLLYGMGAGFPTFFSPERHCLEKAPQDPVLGKTPQRPAESHRLLGVPTKCQVPGGAPLTLTHCADSTPGLPPSEINRWGTKKSQQQGKGEGSPEWLAKG